MAISREEAAGGRVPRWDERARGAFAGMCRNISYTALSSATSATVQSEGSNAHLGYFMKVAGDRVDIQTLLIAAVDFGDNAQTTGETQQQPGLPVP